MLTLPLQEGTFLDFSDLLTGYRLSSLLLLAHDAGIFEAVGQVGCEESKLAAKMGWEPVYAGRFLRCLCSLGLLRQENGCYRLSRFAQTYLWSKSPDYQGHTLVFEQRLQQSWQQLSATLTTGKRAFATENKTPEELEQAYATYLGAMHEAARIRAQELWDAVPVAATTGLLLDLGAGAGTFLQVFMTRYPGWRGLFCDLPEVVTHTDLHRQLSGMADRLSWCACNLLTEEPTAFDAIPDQSCDLVLLSNIVHCQGAEETGRMLQKAASKTSPQGQVVLHDFFSDTGWRGALYDLHMMLNTYNGRTYSRREIEELAAPCGLSPTFSKLLPSGSSVLVLARNPRHA